MDLDCIANDKHSCAMRNRLGIKLLMISIVVPRISIALLMISIVVQ